MNRISQNRDGALTVVLPEPNVAAIPEDFASPGISIAQVLSMIWAHWKKIVLITLIATSLATVTIKFLPKTYTATATLIVNMDLKDPLAGRDFPVEGMSSYVATQIELISNRIVLQPVVDRLNLTADRSLAGGYSGSKDGLLDFVERNLAASIQVERGMGGQLLYLSVSLRDPEKAAIIANAVADVYIAQDRERLNNPASERAQRYTEELAELREKVAAAQDKVTAFRKQNGISDITAGSSDTEVQALENLQQRLLEAQNLRRSLEAKRAGEQISADEAMGSGTVQSLRQQLTSQQAQLALLRSTYGPAHPKVRDLETQIALTRQSLANETRVLSDNTVTELVRTKDLEQKYLHAIAEQQAKVLSLRQAQDEGSKLILELESAKSVYKHALDGFDQIMFQAVANHTNVSFVSRAVPPLHPSKPNKFKLLMMALVAGLGLGIVAPLAYEYFYDRRVRCRDDIERDFGIAVLAQFNRVPELAPTS